MKEYNIKKRRTVEDWIDKEYIAGVKKDNEGDWLIPKLFRPPYTKARARTTTSIYASIVKACILQKSVCAKLYKIPEHDFKLYINMLKEADFIYVKEVDGIEYYYSTLKSQQYEGLAINKLKKVVYDTIQMAITAEVMVINN